MDKNESHGNISFGGEDNEWPALVGNVLLSCSMTGFLLGNIGLYVIFSIIYAGINLARLTLLGNSVPSSTIIFIGLGLKGINLKGWKWINCLMFLVSLSANVADYWELYPLWMELGVISVDVVMAATYLTYLSRTMTHKSHSRIAKVTMRLVGLAIISTVLMALKQPACITLTAYTFYITGRARKSVRLTANRTSVVT